MIIAEKTNTRGQHTSIVPFIGIVCLDRNSRFILPEPDMRPENNEEIVLVYR